ncbi:NADP-dependent oxidoreductase [Bradyrhizobium liaoningense]|uniref:NADP-dependent oxidoreductase n=1 Tax=Bradyrhizobium liaoningense TaxID=43992 RepID=UPI002010D98D|nr:NADP-dependent oxidoreductase [Bradyrhizobium liaoningense]
MSDKLDTGAARSTLPMKAWRVHNFGAPGAMTFETIGRPKPGPGEVLVKIRAAGVGPWDAWIRSGRSALPQPLPLTLGSDLAGEVHELGAGSVELSLGEEVFGVTNKQFLGAYAEYAVACTSMLAKRPKSLSYIEAASVPVVAVTAWQALFEYARLGSGGTVLIHGAAGSVGSYAVQLAHGANVNVVATAAGADMDYVRKLGATKVIDYRNQRFEEHVGEVNAVIDLVGRETQTRSFGVLQRGGRLISTVAPPDQQLAKHHNVSAEFFLVEVTTERLERIAELLDHGKLRPELGAVLSLSEARKAHMMLEGEISRPRGKIVLSVDPPE